MTTIAISLLAGVLKDPASSRSGLRFCLAWSGSKLFAKVISRYQKLQLAGKESNLKGQLYMSRDMRFPTMWYLRPAVLSYWLKSFGVSKLKRRLHRLVWVYTCQKATLLEITCRGSFMVKQLSSYGSYIPNVVPKRIINVSTCLHDFYTFPL